jgi:hypothetical protein
VHKQKQKQITMKKLILGSLIGIGLTTVVAFTVANYEVKKSTGDVEQMQGLYIFTDSKPAMEYEYLGTVKSSFGMDSQYQGVRDKLIGKAKKDFPTADALIMQFKSGGTDKCDAVKFK